MEAFLFALIIILAVIGLSDILHRVWMIFFKPRHEKNILLLLLNDENAVEQISTAIQQAHWYGREFAEKIIGVDMGLSAQQAQYCQSFCIENEIFIFCKHEELEKTIERM